jgi:hypothetical protein
MDTGAPLEKCTNPAASADEAEFARLIGTGIEIGLPAARPIDGVRVGTLVGFTSDTHLPLVVYADQPHAAALPARATLDLHADHIGRQLTLLFENADPCLPIIVGCLQATNPMALPTLPGQVEVDRDGRRLVVSADEQIVLRCGKASITLTKEGKLIIQGAYVSSHSSGVLRINGGSVQIN